MNISDRSSIQLPSITLWYTYITQLMSCCHLNPTGLDMKFGCYHHWEATRNNNYWQHQLQLWDYVENQIGQRHLKGSMYVLSFLKRCLGVNEIDNKFVKIKKSSKAYCFTRGPTQERSIPLADWQRSSSLIFLYFRQGINFTKYWTSSSIM